MLDISFPTTAAHFLIKIFKIMFLILQENTASERPKRPYTFNPQSTFRREIWVLSSTSSRWNVLSRLSISRQQSVPQELKDVTDITTATVSKSLAHNFPEGTKTKPNVPTL